MSIICKLLGHRYWKQKHLQGDIIVLQNTPVFRLSLDETGYDLLLIPCLRCKKPVWRYEVKK